MLKTILCEGNQFKIEGPKLKGNKTIINGPSSEETKVVKASVKEVDVSTDYVYIEIPEEVKNASKIDLVFSVRNRKIVVNLK